MQRDMIWKRLFLVLSICMIVISGCQSQTQKGMQGLFGAVSSRDALQIPKAHTQRPDVLDEGQWLEDDDASNICVHDKKSLVAHRDSLRLLWVEALLTGSAALYAYVSSGVFHRSSSPTRGTLRIVAFILAKDGQKDHLSFI